MPDTLKSQTLAIDDLVSSRCRELGLKPKDVIRRCGYANEAKGIRRFEQLQQGNFESTVGLLRALPGALELPDNSVNEAVETSKRQIQDAREAAWRASFKPHAIILTENTRPEPIFVAALIGVDTLLRIDFDLTSTQATWRTQAIDGIRARLKRWNSSWNNRRQVEAYSLPAFGRPIGFVVNYAVDHAVRYDLEGNAVDMLPAAYRVGRADLRFR